MECCLSGVSRRRFLESAAAAAFGVVAQSAEGPRRLSSERSDAQLNALALARETELGKEYGGI
jgi:hypothetical protein